MALAMKALTLISFFALLMLSIEAQLAPSPSDQDLTFVSYISLSPDASPASAPTPGASNEVDQELLHDMPLPDVADGEVGTKPTVQSQEQVTQMVEKSMQKVEQKIEEFNAILKKRLENPETSAFTQECINQCDQVYGAALDDIKNSMESLTNGDLTKANFDISAVSTNVATCEQCFNEMIGEDPELKKFDEWVKGVTSQALGSLEGVSS